jgi:hypothetical protein
MATLCRIFVAATLLVHLMVGCCSHHAHDCESAALSSPVHSHATHDDQCPENGSDHSHHGADDCEGVKCSFVRSNQIASDSFGRPSQAFLVAVPCDPAAVVGIVSERHFVAADWPALPVRLHLANQVLLI